MRAWIAGAVLGMGLTAGCAGLNKPGVVETPAAVDETTLVLAERLEDVSQKLLQGTPLGVPEMDAVLVGFPQPELFHRDTTVVYVSDGLVKECPTDELLAAHLAREMAAMTLEHRRTLMVSGVIPSQAGAEFGTVEALAAAMLTRAGFDPAVLSRTEARHQATRQNTALAKQLGVAKRPPTWSR